ncbi:MAG: hypothetical protein OEL83_19875 [Desulforhopalus sp.]|nr:hypothetical protein [Desulforhopalus sp.]
MNYPLDITSGDQTEESTMARKRMILSLDENVHSVLMEFSKETGTPAATFVTQLLEETLPKIIQITEMVKLAKANAGDKALEKLMDMTIAADEQIKTLKADMEKTKEERLKKS